MKSLLFLVLACFMLVSCNSDETTFEYEVVIQHTDNSFSVVTGTYPLGEECICSQSDVESFLFNPYKSFKIQGEENMLTYNSRKIIAKDVKRYAFRKIKMLKEFEQIQKLF